MTVPNGMVEVVPPTNGRLMSVDEYEKVVDEKGRPVVRSMTDRELAEETVVLLRATQDLVESFMNDMAKNPMMGMLGKMMGGK